MKAESKTHTLRKKTAQIDFFDTTKQDYVLHLAEGADLTYAVFLKNAELQLTIIAESPTVQGQIFAFVLGDATSLQVAAKLQASHTSINLHLIAIQEDAATVQMQGMIDIAA
jgi:hypothetical protein